jgi:hypothetical protein
MVLCRPARLRSLGFWFIASTCLRLYSHGLAPLQSAPLASLQRLEIGLRELLRILDSPFLVVGIGRHLGKFCIDSDTDGRIPPVGR